MTFSRTVALSCLIATFALDLSALAGHAIDIQLIDRTAAKPVIYRTRMLLETNAFSLDTTSLQGKPSSMLCRKDDAIYLLDHTAKRYVAVNLQALSGDDPVLNWTMGTALRPVLDALDETLRPKFVEKYRDGLRQAYPRESDGATLFPFRRLFILAER